MALSAAPRSATGTPPLRGQSSCPLSLIRAPPRRPLSPERRILRHSRLRRPRYHPSARAVGVAASEAASAARDRPVAPLAAVKPQGARAAPIWVVGIPPGSRQPRGRAAAGLIG